MKTRPSIDLPRAQRRLLVDRLPRSDRRELRNSLRSFRSFAEGFLGVRLLPYQVEAGDAIIRSVLRRDGGSFVLIFARQSGKDELLADLILYLLARLGERGLSIVCAQPTFRPQTVNAMDRLEQRGLLRPFFRSGGLARHHGHVYRFLSARVTYLSADPSASVVGATADRLLILNEAQDINPAVYDKRFAPMAASGNATRVFSGTSWTVDTLLDRERRRLLQLERRDGVRRVFIVDGAQVAACNDYYGRYLDREVERLGREHPLVRTQYFCENVDARSGMFSAAQRLLMQGDRPPLDSPASAPPSSTSNHFAFLLDVAGQEESRTSLLRDDEVGIDFEINSSSSLSTPSLLMPPSPLDSPLDSRFGGSGPPPAVGVVSGLFRSRDSICLRIVEIDLSTLSTLSAPTYRVVHTHQWTGENHVTVFGQLKALAESWRPLHIVIDATGVGEGLWAMLDRAFPTRVIPVKFTQSIKSELGYCFLAIVNTGRFRDCDPSPETDRQYAACECEILPGPLRTMRWGVPDGRRDEEGRPIHDDIVVADSLTSLLDRQKWTISRPTTIIPPRDPLDDMSHFRDEHGY